ncbi:hypothetical protein [Proteus mirabilis]|uniref:hypothetical protein n=1 Tax=Proteus mirabilis TaxID=584 RepID=UPI003556693E
MNNKLSILFPELTVEQLNDLSDWLSAPIEKTLTDRIYVVIERKKNVTLKVINNSLRINNPVAVITEIRKLLANGKIERYSLSEFKTAYRIKK